LAIFKKLKGYATIPRRLSVLNPLLAFLIKNHNSAHAAAAKRAKKTPTSITGRGLEAVSLNVAY
jgi:hypothetical protein